MQLDTFGYPDDATVALTNQVSVGHYLDDVVIPTFLLQGEKDTLFNLQEAVATYRGLKARGVPVKMVWQSWGHSGSTPAPGELDLNGGDIEGTYLGQRIEDWFDHYLKGSSVSTGATFAYFRDWVDYTGNARPAYAETGRYPAVRKPTPLYLSGGSGVGESSGALVSSAGAVRPGTTSWSNPGGGAAASYSETSALQGSAVPDGITPPYDTPGTFGAWTTAPLDADTDLVGMPTLDVRLSSPAVAAVQSTGPASQLLVFAKLYDVAPDGSLTLVNRLISPTRVGDVRRPVHIELPGIVHRVPAGHRLRLVLAATDAAYKNAAGAQPVSVVVDPTSPPSCACPSPADRRPQRHSRYCSLAAAYRIRGCRTAAGQSVETFARTHSTIDAVVAPGVNTLATPICSSSGMSPSGMMPPPKTTMSSASRSLSRSTTLRNSVMCAPESTDRPTASASSAMAASTICSGVWCRPV